MPDYEALSPWGSWGGGVFRLTGGRFLRLRDEDLKHRLYTLRQPEPLTLHAINRNSVNLPFRYCGQLLKSSQPPNRLHLFHGTEHIGGVRAFRQRQPVPAAAALESPARAITDPIKVSPVATLPVESTA